MTLKKKGRIIGVRIKAVSRKSGRRLDENRPPSHHRKVSGDDDGSEPNHWRDTK